MRVVVIGLGSMGKRRIRLIRKYDKNIEIIGLDIKEERRKACSQEYDIATYSTLDDLNKTNISCAFICTAPLSHSDIITDCLQSGMHIFTELNLVEDGYEKNISISKQNNLVLFISSTFLYRDEIKKIKSLTQQANCLLNYNYHVGQYLPDWHPWESYKDYFVGDNKTNGCREIFCIELPWLIDVFGDISNFHVVKNKISELDISYDDNYLLIIEHTLGHKGLIAVDIVSRKPVRNIEIFGEKIYIHWDGSPEGLRLYDYNNKTDMVLSLYKEVDQLDNYSKFVVENAYLNEIVSFFKAIENKTIPIYTFEKDREILRIIDEIEE